MERIEIPIAQERDQDREKSDEFFEMANLFPKHTGLPFVVWISYRGGAQHDIQVKVSPGPKALPLEMASIAIRPDIRVVQGSLSSQDLALISKWIEMNRDVLLRYEAISTRRTQSRPFGQSDDLERHWRV